MRDFTQTDCHRHLAVRVKKICSGPLGIGYST
jgi:hypothetical protein